jgi:hypothetical protein
MDPDFKSIKRERVQTMPTASKEVTIVVNGIPVGVQLNETADGGGNRLVTLPIGKAATDWIKTDANTAACNLAAGHGIVTGKCDVWWDAGYRYGVDVTVTVNALALDGGAGTDFPANAEDSVVVTQQVKIDFPVDGDNLAAIVISCDQECHLNFQESDNTSIYPLHIDAAAEWDWFLSSGIANSLTGDAAGHIMASNSSAVTAATLTIAYVYDSTP